MVKNTLYLHILYIFSKAKKNTCQNLSQWVVFRFFPFCHDWHCCVCIYFGTVGWAWMKPEKLRKTRIRLVPDPERSEQGNDVLEWEGANGWEGEESGVKGKKMSYLFKIIEATTNFKWTKTWLTDFLRLIARTCNIQLITILRKADKKACWQSIW